MSSITFKIDSTFGWPSNYKQELVPVKRERETVFEDLIIDIENCDKALQVNFSQRTCEIESPQKRAHVNDVQQLNQVFQKTLYTQPKFITCIPLKKIDITQSPATIIFELATLLQQTSINHPREGIVFIQGQSGKYLVPKKVQIALIANDIDLTNALKMSLQTIQKIFEDTELCKYYAQGFKDPNIFYSRDHTALRGVLHSINAVSCNINFSRAAELYKFKLIEIPKVEEKKIENHPKSCDKNPGWFEEID